jgi:transposase
VADPLRALRACAANEIDGYRYLTALLVALPRATSVDDYEALQPWRIQLGA